MSEESLTTTTEYSHNVIDSDILFTIDPFTRKITSEEPQKYILMQGDHHSERFTFKLPRYIEGHDMYLCNSIMIHFINSETEKKKDNAFMDGVDFITDLAICEDDEKFLTFSWLVDGNATIYAGVLQFAFSFRCLEGTCIKYSWGTDIYDKIYVSKTLGADLSFEVRHIDAIEKWKENVLRELNSYIDYTVERLVGAAQEEILADYTGKVEQLRTDVNADIDAFTEDVDEKIDGFDLILKTEITNMDNEIDVLKARMNTFTSLPEGSTIADGVIEDMTIGADGMEYGSPAEALRGVDSKIINIVKVTPEWDDGVYISKGGLVSEYARYSAARAIPIRSDVVDKITIITGASVDSTAYCFYDKYDKLVSAANIGVEPVELGAYEIDVPEGAAYLRYSCLTSYISDSCVILHPSFTNISTHHTNVENIIDEPLYVDVLTNAIEGGYVAVGTGKKNTVNQSNLQYAEIEVSGGEEYEIIGYGVDSAALYALYSEDGTCIATVPTTKQDSYVYYEETVTIPDNCTKMIVGHYMSRQATTVKQINFTPYTRNSLRKVKNDASEVENDLAQVKIDLSQAEAYARTNNKYRYAVGNILCIGDSLTAGAYYGGNKSGSAIKQNYPYYLGRMCNCSVTNAGKSGWSASDWVRDYIDAYVYADYDCVTIWLGTNYGCTEMPTDEEINAFVPEEEPTASEANQALYLIHLIKTIRSENPDCLIFIGNVFASKSDVTTNNEIIAKIADKYGLQLLDFSDLHYSQHMELHAGIGNPHFGKAGNIFVADRIADAIHNYILEDPTRAEFGIE